MRNENRLNREGRRIAMSLSSVRPHSDENRKPCRSGLRNFLTLDFDPFTDISTVEQVTAVIMRESITNANGHRTPLEITGNAN